MDFESGLTRPSMRKIIKDLKQLAIPPSDRKRILSIAIRKIKNESIKSTNAQQSPDGKAWKPRKAKNEHQKSIKMLRKIARLSSPQADDKEGRLWFKHKKTSMIALAHQYGLDQEFELSKQGKEQGEREESESENASKSQVKRLLELGYSRKKNNKWRKVSKKEIEQMSGKQAGVIIRKMQGKKQDSKGLKKWIIPTEKRSFLNEDEIHNSKILSGLLTEYLNSNEL